MAREKFSGSFKSTKIHFMGVGGIGMSAIANLSLSAGARVSGCDLLSNNLTEQLKKKGAKICLGHDASHIQKYKPDVLVYSSAVPPSNEELLRAKKEGVHCMTRAALLAYLLADKKTIAVTGSHGKTTTTWIVADILLELNMSPSVMIGGVAGKLKSNFHYGKGEYFVSEVDESDGTLLTFHPSIAIITNVDLEHLDFYSSIDQVESTMKRFISNSHKDGVLIGWGGDKRVKRLFKQSKREFLLYGVDSRLPVCASKVKETKAFTQFDLSVLGKTYKSVKTALIGAHNLQNVLAGISTAASVGLDMDKVLPVVESLEGVKRRFEFKGTIHRAQVVEDYAHHPREVAATLSMAKLKKPKRIVTVFQPHRYTRVQGLWRSFLQAFDQSDIVILMDIYSANEEPIENISSQRLVKSIRKRKKHNSGNVQYIPHRQSIIDYLHSSLKAGDMVIFMGAGDVGRLSTELLADKN